MKMSSFIISMIVVSMFVGVLGAFYANMATQYNVEFDNESQTNIEVYNELTNLQTVTEDINSTLFEVDSGDSGITDLIGSFLGSGFNVLKVSKQSFTSFFTIANHAVAMIPGLDGIIGQALITIVLLMILFIIISTLVGRDV